MKNEESEEACSSERSAQVRKHEKRRSMDETQGAACWPPRTDLTSCDAHRVSRQARRCECERIYGENGALGSPKIGACKRSSWVTAVMVVAIQAETNLFETVD